MCREIKKDKQSLITGTHTAKENKPGKKTANVRRQSPKKKKIQNKFEFTVFVANHVVHGIT